MKRLTLVVMLCALYAWAGAQVVPPVSWDYRAEKLSNDTYLIHIVARMTDGWHIYSQQQPDGAVARPTQISFEKNPLVSLDGVVAEKGKLDKHFYKQLNITQDEYTGSVVFTQKVKLKAPVKTNLVGKIGFQVCTDESCLPPDEKRFMIALR